MFTVLLAHGCVCLNIYIYLETSVGSCISNCFRFLSGVPLSLYKTFSHSPLTCLFPGYHAPLDLYPEFHRIAKDPSVHTVPEGRPVNVCVGKEWYRFPSSFLLPNK